jgi:hypothetical protein
VDRFPLIFTSVENEFDPLEKLAPPTMSAPAFKNSREFIETSPANTEYPGTNRFPPKEASLREKTRPPILVSPVTNSRDPPDISPGVDIPVAT